MIPFDCPLGKVLILQCQPPGRMQLMPFKIAGVIDYLGGAFAQLEVLATENLEATIRLLDKIGGYDDERMQNYVERDRLTILNVVPDKELPMLLGWSHVLPRLADVIKES